MDNPSDPLFTELRQIRECSATDWSSHMPQSVWGVFLCAVSHQTTQRHMSNLKLRNHLIFIFILYNSQLCTVFVIVYCIYILLVCITFVRLSWQQWLSNREGKAEILVVLEAIDRQLTLLFRFEDMYCIKHALIFILAFLCLHFHENMCLFRRSYWYQGRGGWSCASDTESAQTQCQTCQDDCSLPLGHPSLLFIRYQHTDTY